MDTDRDAAGNAIGAIGKGGIRDHGPHKEVTTNLDDDSKSHLIIMAPRYSYKSSIIEGFIVRKILRHPNISILLCMHEQMHAEERCRTIRDILTDSELIRQMFGDAKGPVWKANKFVTAWRTDSTLNTPTLFVGSPQKIPTGGRPNIVIFDDIVSDQNYKTEAGLKKGRECIERSLSLGSRGERYIDVGTPYHPGDAHHWCLEQPGWHRLVHLDVGFELVVKDDKALDLSGEGRWPNLSIEFLRNKLRGGMSFPVFMSQFMLKVVSGFKQAFERTHFQPCQWQEGVHGDLTGYLLTDTAPSGIEGSDLNVLMYIGVDGRNRVYILDLEVGHWKMYEFCSRYLEMLQRWSAKVTHRTEVWEKGHSFHSYFQHLQITSRERKLQVRASLQTRNSSSSSKDARIAGLQVRFQSREIFVMNTVPKTWVAGAEVRSLWDSCGEVDPLTGLPLPGGDLVEQFVRFPYHMKKDIPDTLALVDSIDKETQARVCYYIKPSRHRLPESVERKQAPGLRLRGSATRFYDRIRTRDR